jgi:hypothetical protein
MRCESFGDALHRVLGLNLARLAAVKSKYDSCQRVAWRRVADPLVTNFERREIRNHIKESDEQLRYYLGMMSERLRCQTRPVEVGDSPAKPKLRLLLA